MLSGSVRHGIMAGTGSATVLSATPPPRACSQACAQPRPLGQLAVLREEGGGGGGEGGMQGRCESTAWEENRRGRWGGGKHREAHVHACVRCRRDAGRHRNKDPVGRCAAAAAQQTWHQRRRRQQQQGGAAPTLSRMSSRKKALLPMRSAYLSVSCPTNGVSPFQRLFTPSSAAMVRPQWIMPAGGGSQGGGGERVEGREGENGRPPRRRWRGSSGSCLGMGGRGGGGGGIQARA